MASSLLDRKYDRVFGRLDVDDNGVINKADIKVLGERLLGEFGESPESAKARAFVAQIDVFWRRLAALFDANNDEQITAEEFRAGMTAAFVDQEAGFADIFRPALRGLIEIMDDDEDGFLDYAEFEKMQRAFRTPPEKIPVAFQKLDTDGDERLSVEEFLQAIQTYYSSTDSAEIGNWLFGPI